MSPGCLGVGWGWESPREGFLVEEDGHAAEVPAGVGRARRWEQP